MKCSAPETAADAHEIKDGDRRIEIPALTVDWGKKDLRDTWTGAYNFCSFQCLVAWAAEKAEQHDLMILSEGIETK